MKKALVATFFVLLNFNYAQDLSKEVSLSQNWISSVNGDKLNLSNIKISNHSNKNTRNLSLNLYLSTVEYDSNSMNVDGTLIAQNPIETLKKNTSTAISIEHKIKELPADGEYFQILVLSEKGKVKDIVQSKYKAQVRNGKLEINTSNTLNKSSDDLENKKAINQDPSLTDINQPKSIIINNNDSSLTLEKDWKVNIDMSNFLVILAGGEIANKRPKETNKLSVEVYLTKNPQSELTSNFEGFMIAQAPLNPIGMAQTVSYKSIKMNLRTYIPKNTYYILMTLSEIDENGNTVVKSVKSFPNAVSFQ